MKPLNRLALRNEPEAAHHEGLWWQDVSEWTEKKYGGVGDSEKKGRGQKNREEWTVTPNTLGFAQWVKVEPSSSELPCTWHESCFQDAPEPPLQAITFRVCCLPRSKSHKLSVLSSFLQAWMTLLDCHSNPNEGSLFLFPLEMVKQMTLRELRQTRGLLIMVGSRPTSA